MRTLDPPEVKVPVSAIFLFVYKNKNLLQFQNSKKINFLGGQKFQNSKNQLKNLVNPLSCQITAKKETKTFFS
jgi:hypothetical protein